MDLITTCLNSDFDDLTSMVADRSSGPSGAGLSLAARRRRCGSFFYTRSEHQSAQGGRRHPTFFVERRSDDSRAWCMMIGITFRPIHDRTKSERCSLCAACGRRFEPCGRDAATSAKPRFGRLTERPGIVRGNLLSQGPQDSFSMWRGSCANSAEADMPLRQPSVCTTGRRSKFGSI